jgi:tripartite-type tricarboxylate transporter receptor subunit TctC
MVSYCQACIAGFLLALAGSAVGQSYPSKPIRWIVPLAPGGSTDLISRVIAQKLAEAWGTQVIPDNRPGSGGTIGLAAAAKAPPDGYTIVLVQLSNVGLAPGFYPKLGYDPVTDLAPVTEVLSTPMILVAHSSLPVKNARELLVLARAKPDALTYGSAGNGSIGHLAGEMIKSMSGMKMTHIPYKGASQAITELAGGQISLCVSTIPPALSLIKAGKLKALGVTSSMRMGSLPDVPTIAESGIKGYEVYNWYGVMVPAGTPKEIIAKLHSEIVRILKISDVRDRLTVEGGEVVANTPEEFGAFIRAEIPRWSNVIKSAGAKVD